MAERHDAIQCIQNVFPNPEEVYRQAYGLAKLLDDEHWRVRWKAVEALRCLDAAKLAQFVDALAARMSDSDGTVRAAALQCLLKAGPEAVCRHAGGIAELLKDKDRRLRLNAAKALHCLDAARLASFEDALAAMMSDQVDVVREAALQCLLKAGPKVALPHVLAVALGAPQDLGLLLDQNVDAAWLVLDSDCSEAQRPVLQALDGVEVIPAELAKYAHSRTQEGQNTLLHLAAQEGMCQLCRQLIQFGALTAVMNAQGLTPLALAEERGHEQVKTILTESMKISTTRSGTGNAFKEAQGDPRSVVQLEWYTHPLPGMTGKWLGGCHSLLAVTVADTKRVSLHTYVIEKAARSQGGGLGDESEKQFENGVFISHWVDVQPLIRSHALHCLQPEQIQKDMKMEALRQVAVNLGPYNLASCNCHHAVQAVFNACAQEGARVEELPNKELMRAAQGLTFIAGNLAGSAASVSSQSRPCAQSRLGRHLGSESKLFSSSPRSCRGEEELRAAWISDLSAPSSSSTPRCSEELRSLSALSSSRRWSHALGVDLCACAESRTEGFEEL